MMKALLLAALFISTASFAQGFNIVCEADGYDYFIQTQSPVIVALQPTASHPEILSDMIVIQERVLRGRCLELCIDIPFYNEYSNKIGESLLSIRGKGNAKLSATFTSVDGDVSEAYCRFL